MKGFEMRGVVEGFYGKPWTMDQRMDMMDFLGKKGYNLYIYAPKADPFHRERWREDYPLEFLDSFHALVDRGQQVGVDVGVAVSPGLSLVYSDAMEMDLLEKKFGAFLKREVRTVCLFLDDIPPQLSHESDRQRYASLAAAQADFANRLQQRLDKKCPGLRFILCPTHYHGKADQAYLGYLGEHLDPRIHVMWTGPQVCSRTIPWQDAHETSMAFRRPVLYWDNFPVNDATMVPELHIGPYTGRDAELVDYSVGIVVNPMNQPYASMIPLASIADFLSDPRNFDPERSLRESMEEIVPTGGEALWLFMKANNQSPLDPGEPSCARELVQQIASLKESGNWDEMNHLLESAGNKWISAARELKAKLPPLLASDVQSWLGDFETWGQVLVATARMLGLSRSLFHDQSPSPEHLEAIRQSLGVLEQLLVESISMETFTAGSKIRTFAVQNLVICKGMLRLVHF